MYDLLLVQLKIYPCSRVPRLIVKLQFVISNMIGFKTLGSAKYHFAVIENLLFSSLCFVV